MKAESPYFSNICKWGTAGGLGEALFYFECWKFTENPKIEEFSENMILARARARGRTRIKKFEKYGLSAFTGKKNY